ncbi:MAG: YbgC/FadM family acyl-CoA thioesterase [Alphaproteobacteria bacterium]
MSNKYHSIESRVYYENTDAGGIVYHGQYLNFAERGRTELLRKIGYQSSDLTKEHGIMFVARHVDINYYAPAFLDDLLEIRTSVAALKNSSFTMRQTLFRHKDALDKKSEEEKIAEVMVTLVCVKANGIKPLRVPDMLREKFTEYLER